jgi:hypothetical protein
VLPGVKDVPSPAGWVLHAAGLTYRDELLDGLRLFALSDAIPYGFALQLF